MKKSNDCGVESDNLCNLSKSYEKIENKVGSILHDAVVLGFGVDTGDDFKALGRIKLEDLEIQESVLEFECEFDKFIVQQTGDYCYVQNDGGYNNDILNTVNVVEDFEIKESLLDKILDFFNRLYQDNEEVVDFDYEIGLSNYRNKKKRFILESIIAFLKKLLLNGQSLNLKQLLDRQILELQEQLSKELDPALRKLLQERLMLLSELRTQLMGIGINSKLLFNFFMLSSLINAAPALRQEDAAATRESSKWEKTVGLFISGKDVRGYEGKVIGSQISGISHNNAVLLSTQYYMQSVLRGGTCTLSYRFHDKYFFVQKDMSFNAMSGMGMQYGALLAVIIRVISTVVSKVRDVVKGAINLLDDTVSYRQHTHSATPIVKPLSPLNYSYVDYVNFRQNVECSQKIPYLSLSDYRAEVKLSYSTKVCSAYLQSVEVTQAIICQSSESQIDMGRIQ
ncbi:MAG: hypothetical protein ACTJLM_00490 [Ehrlichia sp.]